MNEYLHIDLSIHLSIYLSAAARSAPALRLAGSASISNYVAQK